MGTEEAVATLQVVSSAELLQPALCELPRAPEALPRSPVCVHTVSGSFRGSQPQRYSRRGSRRIGCSHSAKRGWILKPCRDRGTKSDHTPLPFMPSEDLTTNTKDCATKRKRLSL